MEATYEVKTPTREEQVAEAKKRLKTLEKMGLHENVLLDFSERNLLNYSERMPFGGTTVGVLYWATDDNNAFSKNGISFEQTISEFEKERNAVVYHATHEFTEFGELLDLFYVSQYSDEWDDDNAIIKEGRALSHVINLDDAWSSETGFIEFAVKGGGIVRTA